MPSKCGVERFVAESRELAVFASKRCPKSMTSAATSRAPPKATALRTGLRPTTVISSSRGDHCPTIPKTGRESVRRTRRPPWARAGRRVRPPLSGRGAVVASTCAYPRTSAASKIKAVLGIGTYGRVLLAFDPELHRQVAIKQPHGEGLRPEFREDFVKEGRRDRARWTSTRTSAPSTKSAPRKASSTSSCGSSRAAH